MTIYYILLLFTFLLCVIPFSNNKYNSLLFSNYLFKLYLFIILILIGFRYRVGGDWITYHNLYIHYSQSSIEQIIPFQKEWLFPISNWLFSKINSFLGYYLVNLFSGFIFLYGIYFFCKKYFSNPYLCFLIYFFPIIYIGLGNTRQSLVLGIIFLILANLKNYSSIKKIIYLGIACAFHSTAIITLPLIFFSKTKLKITLSFLFIIFIVLLILRIDLVLVDIIYGYLHFFKPQFNSSSGIYFKNFLTFISLILFLVFFKNFKKDELFYLFLFFFIMAISLLILGFFYSTVGDRLLYYTLPFNLLVINKFINSILIKELRILSIISLGVYNLLLLLVWFMFGNSSVAWSKFLLIVY